MRRRLQLTLIIITFAALCAANAMGLETNPIITEVPQQRERIDNFVKVIQKESLEDSITLLSTDEQQYFHPGFYSGNKFAQLDLETMLSTRRSIKVIQTIRNLPPSEQQIKSREMFDKALLIHTNHCSMGSQLALCAAMFLAADLGQRNLLAEEFARLDQAKEAFSARSATNAQSGLPLCFLPDNRFQVNVLRLVALRAIPEPKLLAQVDEECKRVEMRKSAVTIVPWDARTTWFEILVGSPMDTSKGSTKYEFYDWNWGLSGKEEEIAVVNNLRKLVLQ